MKLQLILSLEKKGGVSVLLPVTFEGASSSNGGFISIFSSDSNVGRGLIVANRGEGASMYDLDRPLGDNIDLWKKSDGEGPIEKPRCSITSAIGDHLDDIRTKCWCETYDSWSIVADTHNAQSVVKVFKKLMKEDQV